MNDDVMTDRLRPVEPGGRNSPLGVVSKMLDVLIGIRPANFIRARSHEGCFVEAGHIACTRPTVQIVIKTPCNAENIHT